MEQDLPERRRIVVDGSNIATEGRTMPSLAQLDEAIRAFLEEYRGFTTSDVTVVVDASFGHRIDPSEVAAFDQAVEHGEMITPPAGRGGGEGRWIHPAHRREVRRAGDVQRFLLRVSTPSAPGCSSPGGSSGASRCPACWMDSPTDSGAGGEEQVGDQQDRGGTARPANGDVLDLGADAASDSDHSGWRRYGARRGR